MHKNGKNGALRRETIRLCSRFKQGTERSAAACSHAKGGDTGGKRVFGQAERKGF